MDEENKEVSKKSGEKCCDCRMFLIALLTSIIVVLAYHIGIKAFKMLCASCRAQARPACACCCGMPQCGRPGKPFCGPKGMPGKCDKAPAFCPVKPMPRVCPEKPALPPPAPAPAK
ncbi:MAG: hypothetical protein MR051_03585 [Lentisphaeria bacterium]|nr:hypothetical protein [Lentisphaeria bacterium]